MTNIKLELGLDAQRFIQQIQINNQRIEELVQKGIEQAISEIENEENFVLAIKENALQQLRSHFINWSLGYENKNAIIKAVNEKVGKKIDEYAQRIADKMTKDLETI